MIITETQRFVYELLALTFVTIAILVLLNVYALEIFLMLIIIEFLVLVELTKPSVINLAWRRNIAIFVVICVIVFAILAIKEQCLWDHKRSTLCGAVRVSLTWFCCHAPSYCLRENRRLPRNEAYQLQKRQEQEESDTLRNGEARSQCHRQCHLRAFVIP